MRSDTLPSDNPALDRFCDRVNLFWLAAFFLVLSIWMSPVLLSWMVLIARASIVFARNAWMQLVTFVFAPVHQLTRMAANFWLLFKVSAINFSFSLAAMTGASKHDEFCRKDFEQSRRQSATQVLLCYDTLVKSVTAVAAMRYCLLAIEANQLFVPTGYLIVMGCGTMIQGLLGLRVVAIRLCAANRRQLSPFALNYRDLIMAFNHWRERRFGRLSTHLCSDLILITVLGMATASCFAYSLVWPLFYLMVAVQNAYQLFDYFVRDMVVLCTQCWYIVRYKHMWLENMLVPCRSRLSAMARALGAVSVFGLLRALLGYVCLVGYVGLQPWSILRLCGCRSHY